jgi:hypothetical protein
MNSVRQFAFGAVVVAVSALSANSAKANPFLDFLFTPSEPPAYYSPARYLAPTAARVNDHFHTRKISVYAPDRHPEIPPTVYSSPAPINHPTLMPDQAIIPVPVAPATSKAR